jgi:hypothetical protein
LLLGATRRSVVGARRRHSSVRGADARRCEALSFLGARRLALALGIAIWANTTSAEAAVVDPELRLVIRTYDANAAVNTLPAALAAAATILEEAGVGVTWVSCDTVFVRRDENPCLAPLAANELAVRFIRLSPHLAEPHVVTLGDSLVDIRLGTGSLATIYVDRVVTLAARCGVDPPTLMGRAVAHEIGHLLLGTATHASAGLMRASWSQAALRRADDDWTFTDADASTLRERVRARHARRLAAGRIGE